MPRPQRRAHHASRCSRQICAHGSADHSRLPSSIGAPSPAQRHRRGPRAGTVPPVNVLVVVSGGLTETLQATPLLRTLRAGLPEAHITLAAPSRAQQLAGGLPAVDATLCLRSL